MRPPVMKHGVGAFLIFHSARVNKDSENAWNAVAEAGRGKQAAGRKGEEQRAARREAGKRAKEEAAEQERRIAPQAARSSRGREPRKLQAR